MVKPELLGLLEEVNEVIGGEDDGEEMGVVGNSGKFPMGKGNGNGGCLTTASEGAGAECGGIIIGGDECGGNGGRGCKAPGGKEDIMSLGPFGPPIIIGGGKKCGGG